VRRAEEKQTSSDLLGRRNQGQPAAIPACLPGSATSYKPKHGPQTLCMKCPAEEKTMSCHALLEDQERAAQLGANSTTNPTATSFMSPHRKKRPRPSSSSRLCCCTTCFRVPLCPSSSLRGYPAGHQARCSCPWQHCIDTSKTSYSGQAKTACTNGDAGRGVTAPKGWRARVRLLAAPRLKVGQATR